MRVTYIYMLLAGWEVRIRKTRDRGLENAARRGQHFQARGHSFTLYGQTLSRPVTCLSFFRAPRHRVISSMYVKRFSVSPRLLTTSK